MKTKLIIHPNELSKRWIDTAKSINLNCLALHSVGNTLAHINLANDLKLFNSKKFKSLVNYAKESGIDIEYEVHSASYLLPRELFATHPEYFRMDSNGERTPECNFCASNKEALEIMAKNAVKLCENLYGSSNDYYLWTDDIKGAYCKCPECSKLSPSDQNLLLMNAIIKELKKKNKNARLAYLAYYDSAFLPTKVTPEEGIFLEYAPYERDLYKPARIVSQDQIKIMKDLLKFFGKQNSYVLEYWVDNSYFSKYEKPPKKLTVDSESIKKDIDFYLNVGFENLSSFACFLGDDYVELFSAPDLSAFKK